MGHGTEHIKKKIDHKADTPIAMLSDGFTIRLKRYFQGSDQLKNQYEDPDKDGALRLQIVGGTPEDYADARIIIDHINNLLTSELK